MGAPGNGRRRIPWGRVLLALVTLRGVLTGILGAAILGALVGSIFGEGALPVGAIVGFLLGWFFMFTDFVLDEKVWGPVEDLPPARPRRSLRLKPAAHEPAPKNCPECGEQVEGDAIRCRRCGTLFTTV